MLDIGELNALVARSKAWVRSHGGPPSVKVGQDEAGPWFEVAESGPDVTWCLVPTRNRTICKNRAGAGTNHLGAGPCWQHEDIVGVGRPGRGEASVDGTRLGAWIMAHGFAAALEVTPWEGLLWAVRIAAGRVAWIEAKLGTAQSDRQLEPPNPDSLDEGGRTPDQGGTNMYHWVKQSEVWHDKMAKVSKLAIDAGVAERLVRQLELEVQLMLRASIKTFDELGLNEDQRERGLAIMSRALLELEAAEVGVE